MVRVSVEWGNGQEGTQKKWARKAKRSTSKSKGEFDRKRSRRLGSNTAARGVSSQRRALARPWE